MIVDNKFDIEQTVYLKTDIEQLPRLIRSFQVYKTRIAYELVLGVNDSWHDEFEISSQPINVNTKDAKIEGFKKDGFR
jgi:hypothetical protein